MPAPAGSMRREPPTAHSILVWRPQFAELPDARSAIEEANDGLTRVEAMLQSRQPRPIPPTTSSGHGNRRRCHCACHPNRHHRRRFPPLPPTATTAPSTSPSQLNPIPTKPELLRNHSNHSPQAAGEDRERRPGCEDRRINQSRRQLPPVSVRAGTPRRCQGLIS